MTKYCLIRQPAGLGDIFMCLKIAKAYQDKGYEIVWPIQDNYLYINDYLNVGFKFIPISSTFVGKDLINLRIKSVIDTPELLYLPLQDASHIVGEPVMDAKFRLAGVSIDNYLDYFNFTRNKQREEALYYKKLELLEVSKYRLINKNYVSLPDVRQFNEIYSRCAFYSPINLYNIEMIVYENSHIFDWCMVIENATEFHTIGTSITFIAEKLDLKADSIYMYRRPEAHPHSFEIEKSLFNKNWKFIQ